MDLSVVCELDDKYKMVYLKYDVFGSAVGTDLDAFTAQKISEVVLRNYPESHSHDMRESDLDQGYRDFNGIIARVRQGSKFLTLSETDLTEGRRDLVGLLEGRFCFPFGEDGVRSSEGLYAQISWLIIDPRYQGLKLASQLHQKWIEIAAQTRDEYRIQIAAQLCVHPDNPAKNIYKAWGYKEDEKSSDGRDFMFLDF